jgi:CDP-glucose 4,6-dehydratase
VKSETLRDLFDNFYQDKRVFLTGHTGFKGSWLALWLHALGAKVMGYALAPPTVPSLFESAGVAETLSHVEADIRDASRLHRELEAAQPDIVFHLAAQSLVRVGYERPLETLDTNVMGTAHLLEALRATVRGRRCAVVVITSDKCYENREWIHGYRETDRLGGRDPYSMSKGAVELLVAAWRSSYFPTDRISVHGVGLATARAGNVIGGGDWAKDRIVPDCVRALLAGEPIPVRNPSAARPWQHVLEPLSGYLHLGARLFDADAHSAGGFADAWNFGPRADGVWTVGRLVEELTGLWGDGSWNDRSEPNAPHEARWVALSTDKAFHRLGWTPTWDVRRALEKTVEWYAACAATHGNVRALTAAHIDEYVSDAAAAGAHWASSATEGRGPR